MVTYNDKAMTAGQLVVFSEGEYSDYGYTGSFVALQDVTWEEMNNLAEEVRLNNGYKEYNWGIHSEFIAAVIRKGWVVCVDLNEIHIGSYGRLEINF